MESQTVSDVLEKSIQVSQADACILRWMRREQLQTTVVDGLPGTSSKIVLSGIGCRSLVKGSWGFASSTDVSDIEDLIRKSEKIASYRSGSSAVDKIPGSSVKDIDSPNTSAEIIQEFYEFSRNAYKHIESFPHVHSCRIGIMVICDEKVTVTSDGVFAHVVEPRMLGNVTVIVKSEGKITHYSEVIGGRYQYSMLQQLSDAAERAAETALHRLTIASLPSGTQKVLLGGEAVGLLIHEAVGHAAEADIVHTGSCLSQKMGEKVASSLVSVIDDPTLIDCFGTIKIDDEGVKGKKTAIISNGILSSYLHSRDTAHTMGVEPTGNARAWLYSREPKVRMTNTFLDTGDYSFEELTEEIKDGVYLKGSEGGNAFPAGRYMIITTLAQKIENGELQPQFYRGPVIMGNTLETLQHIEAVGDEKTFVIVPSMCGKGGSAFVGQGGPSVVTRLYMGGSPHG